MCRRPALQSIRHQQLHVPGRVRLGRSVLADGLGRPWVPAHRSGQEAGLRGRRQVPGLHTGRRLSGPQGIRLVLGAHAREGERIPEE